MEPKEEKITATKQTLMYMERLSKFSYYDGIEIRLSDQSHMLDNAMIEKMVLLKEVVESDFFILKALAELSWANVEMLVEAVRKMHLMEPEKAIPPATRDTIKSRVVRLCKTSLAKGFEYVTSSNTPIKVYCATDAGITLIRRKLYYSGNSEVFNALNPCEEIFRRLACNYVAQRLCSGKTGMRHIPGTVEYVAGKGKVFLYSRLYRETEDQKKVIIFEPMYFRANPLLNSRNDMINYIKHRLSIFRCFEKKAIADGYNVSVVFVVEDYSGLKEAVSLLKEELNENSTNIYFTSENAIYSSENADRGVLKIKEVTEGKPTLVACNGSEFS